MQRMAPLATVLVLLGPGTALAASPAPDAAPAGADAGALSPDPVPTVPTRVAPTRPAPRRSVQVVDPLLSQATPPPLSAVRKPAPAKPRAKKHHATPVRIVDVVPLRVDVHRGLGAITSQVRNTRFLALAAAALLAAAFAAASGTALTLLARRSQ
jgi:hypothetical protein